MIDFLSSSAYFGLALTLGMFFLARSVNKKAGREVFNPLLFATVICVMLIALQIPYEAYEKGARHIDVLLTPATICLAIPLYRQYTLLRKNFGAVLAGIAAGVIAHMGMCIVLLFAMICVIYMAVTDLPCFR